MSQSKCIGGQLQGPSRENSTSSRSVTANSSILAILCSFCHVHLVDTADKQYGKTEPITALMEIIALQLGQGFCDVPPSDECLEEWRKLCSGCKGRITGIWKKKKAIGQLTLELAREIEHIQQTVAHGSLRSVLSGLPVTSTLLPPILQSYLARPGEMRLPETERKSSSIDGNEVQGQMEVEQDMSDVVKDGEDTNIHVDLQVDDSRTSEEGSFLEEGNVIEGKNAADDVPITEVGLPNQTFQNKTLHEDHLPGPSSAMQRLPASLPEVNVLNSTPIDDSLADRGSVKNIKRKARATHGRLDDEDEVLTVCSPEKSVKRNVASNVTMKQHISESNEGGNCLVCKQYFPNMKSLQNHKITHTEDERKNFRESVKFRDDAPIFHDNRVRQRAEAQSETERHSSSTAENSLRILQNSMEVEAATSEAEGGDKDADIHVNESAEVVSLIELENMSENDSSIAEECQDNLAENGNMNQEQSDPNDVTNTESDMTNQVFPNVAVDEQNLQGPSSAISGLRVSPPEIESSQQDISNGNSADTIPVTSETVQIIKQEERTADAQTNMWGSEEEREILTESEKPFQQAEQQKRKLKRQRIESYNGVKVVFCDGPGLNTNNYLQCSICSFIVCSPKKTVKWADTPMLAMKKHISNEHKDGPGRKCLICEQHFPDTKSLRNHKATHSEEERIMGRESLKQRETVSKLHKKPVLIPKDTSEEIACYVCYQLFPNKVACESHLIDHRKDILRNKYVS